MTYLFQSINTRLRWHPSRVKCFFEIALGMIQSRSVQMQHIAAHFKDHTSLEGRIQRIYRFFVEQKINYHDIARLILSCVSLDNCPLDLVLDRTNWSFGNTNINYLVLAMHVQGFGAIPLLWVELSKKGNSNTSERIDLLRELFQIFPYLQIRSLTADREFIGKHWIGYLMQHAVPFYIRIKENRLVDWGGEEIHVGHFFDHLTIGGKARKLYKTIDGHDLTFVGARSKDGDLVIILTNTDTKASLVIEIYKTRWMIECLFKNVKGNGFNLEDTHITISERLEKLMAVCTFAVALCVRAGISKHAIKPIPYKKTVQSQLYSFFKYGLNHIRRFYDDIFQWLANLKAYTDKTCNFNNMLGFSKNEG